MVGEAIEIRETLVQLSLVGESCECETARGWLDERVLPHRWLSGERERASQRLGFDPERPSVGAEMIRIYPKGRNALRGHCRPHRSTPTAFQSPQRTRSSVGCSDIAKRTCERMPMPSPIGSCLLRQPPFRVCLILLPSRFPRFVTRSFRERVGNWMKAPLQPSLRDRRIRGGHTRLI
jgi:hypothetical protein